MKNCARKKFLGGLHAITGDEVKSSRRIGMGRFENAVVAQAQAPPYHTDYPSRFGHLKPLSPPKISFLGLCYSWREDTMALAMKMPRKSLTSTRGFASMDREKQLAIARKGGESVPNEKRSFSQNRRLAAEAGRKGGQSVNPTNRSFSRNHVLASEAGRKGGHASHPGPKKAGDQE
jgi:uncharacterized protein